jgi:hypothetical protein
MKEKINKNGYPDRKPDIETESFINNKDLIIE